MPVPWQGAFLLWGSLPLASSQSQTDKLFIEDSPEGCFHAGFRFTPVNSKSAGKFSSQASGLQHCQVIAQGDASGDHGAIFNYYPLTGDCEVGDVMTAQLVRDPDTTVIAGYGLCPLNADADTKPGCEDETPKDGFPGRSDNQSNLAWPSGRQPYSLECWPKASLSGNYMPCASPTVLQDTSADPPWPGKCTGLTLKPNANDTEACKLTCQKNPLCAAWQQTYDGQCYQGVGQNCFVRENFAPKAAQRLQQGQVRKLMDLTGWEIKGLSLAFTADHGYFLVEASAVEACRLICYSDIQCQYWQFIRGSGCFVEDASSSNSPPWPLTLSWAMRDTDKALNCINGEFIQHRCPADQIIRPDPLLSAGADTVTLGCGMTKGVLWEPNMALAPTNQDSALSCQQHCANTLNCYYFALWPNGKCYLQNQHATAKQAPDYKVLAGTGLCMSTPKPLPGSRGFFTPAGTEVLSKGMSAETTPQPMPSADGSTFVRIEATIDPLQYSALTASQRKRLSQVCAEAVALSLDANIEDVMDEPGGNTGNTLLTRNSDPDGPEGVWMQAYMASSQAGFIWLRGRVRNWDFAKDIQTLLVNNHLAGQDVTAKSMDVHLEQGVVALGASHGHGGSLSTGIVFAMLAVILGVGCAGAVYVNRSGAMQRQRGSKGRGAEMGSPYGSQKMASFGMSSESSGEDAYDSDGMGGSPSPQRQAPLMAGSRPGDFVV